jgi:hypothetical protein
VLPQAHDYIRGSSPRILVDDRASAAPVPSDREVFQERQYYLPLHEVLVQSKELSQDRLVSFVRTAVDHLHGRRSHVPQDRHDAEPPTPADGGTAMLLGSVVQSEVVVVLPPPLSFRIRPLFIGGGVS